jgi:glucokinase
VSFVGIDLGGTSVRLVLVDRAGRVLGRATAATAPERGASETLGAIIASVRRLQAQADVALEALGIGVTGPVDPYTGVVTNPFTLGGWPATDLRAPFKNAFAIPVAVDNDANVAAIGEWWMGAGRGFSRVVLVTLGTGIGVASLVDGNIQRAVDGRHGEAGHMVIDPHGPPCYCGANGCWESLASGTAIGRAAREVTWRRDGEMWRSAAGNPDSIDATLLFRAAAGGDGQAGAMVDEIASWIGLGLVNLASTVMPDVFILAGGVARQLESMRPAIEKVLHRHSVVVPSIVPLVPAQLGDDAGPIGAAKLAIDLVVESHASPRMQR